MSPHNVQMQVAAHVNETTTGRLKIGAGAGCYLAGRATAAVVAISTSRREIGVTAQLTTAQTELIIGPPQGLIV